MPIQEQFAFCFNTALSDIAARLPKYRDVIVNAQVISSSCVFNLVLLTFLQNRSLISRFIFVLKVSALHCAVQSIDEVLDEVKSDGQEKGWL